MNRLIIIGASGHGRVVANVARLCGYKDIIFLDDNNMISSCAGFPVVGRSDEAPSGAIIVAIGENETRKRLMDFYSEREQPVLIHPSAVIAEDVEIGKGSVIMAGAIINPGVKIGCGVIVNTSSSIDHDCIIGDYCHVSVGARLCGTVVVGGKTMIGAGSTIINNVLIHEGCKIGAGAVVTHDLLELGTYVGIPARILKQDSVQ